MGFVNSVVVCSDDGDDDIFKPERCFSGVYYTFVNQWCIKKDKSVFKFAFRFHAFLEIPEALETHVHKLLNFQQ